MMWTAPKAKIMSALDWFSLGLFFLPNQFNVSLGCQCQAVETVCYTVATRIRMGSGETIVYDNP